MLVQRVLGFLEVHDNDDTVGFLWLFFQKGSEQSHGDCLCLAGTWRTLDLEQLVARHCSDNAPALVSRLRRPGI